MCTDRDKYTSSAQILVQLVLQVDEGVVRELSEVDISEDSTCEVWSNLFCLRGLESTVST